MYDKIIQISTSSGGTFYELPEPASISYQANDVDKDAYTNLAGKTIRQRVRKNVMVLKLGYNVLTAAQVKTIFDLIDPVWFYVKFYNPTDNAVVTKKMYCSPKDVNLLLHKNTEASANTLYSGMSFEFIEE